MSLRLGNRRNSVGWNLALLMGVFLTSWVIFLSVLTALVWSVKFAFNLLF